MGGNYYAEESGKVVGTDPPLAEVTIRKRYTEVTRILGHQLMSPFGAFGIWAWTNEEYMGNREGRRSGAG